MYPIIRNCEKMCQSDVRFSEQQRWEMYDSEKTFVFNDLGSLKPTDYPTNLERTYFQCLSKICAPERGYPLADQG